METVQRSVREQTDDMGTGSAFQLPEGREKISARYAAETIQKVNIIVQIWKVQTRIEKEQKVAADVTLTADQRKARVEEAVKDIDRTFVLDKLIKKAADEEFEELGAKVPENQAELDKLLAIVAASAKTKAKK